MAVDDGSVAAKAASENDTPRPQPQRQFRLMPVPLRGMPAWNDAILRWATA